jgi:hypothetical protein
MIATLEPTNCGHDFPELCKQHGGRTVKGKPAPREWIKKEKASPKKGKGARQQHGLDEEIRITNLYDLIQTKKGHLWDAITKTEDPKGVQIKLMKMRGTIDLASYWRNANKCEPHYLHVSFYKEDPKCIHEEYTFYFPEGVWSAMFPPVYNEEIRALISEATNEESYDAIWAQRKNELQAKWATLDTVMKLAPKRDHGTQLRMQCSISYKDLMNLYEKFGVGHLPKGPNSKI